MESNWNAVRTQTLTPEEIEALIAKDFGSKVNPVDFDELARSRQAQERLRAFKKPWGRRS
jgi:hypothetical protein